MRSNRLFMVSAGLLKPKKENNILNKRNLYPNYGLISLATILETEGYDPLVIHGDYKKPQIIIDLMSENGFEQSTHPILLSLPSFFSLEWAQIFCHKIKKQFPKKEIIVGGKWVVNGNQKWIGRKLKGVHSFVSGNSEGNIKQIVDKTIIKSQEGNSSDYRSIPAFFNYKLVHEFDRYQPSIEIARGCGKGCFFCLESKSPYQVFTSPQNAIKNILKLQEIYGGEKITPYFQASFFYPNKDWCLDFHKYYNKFHLATKWRTQTRVDSLSSNKIELLSKSGLKVLDLGLESANPAQILSMGKSKNPDKYLKQASKLFKICHENGIWLKINILLYAGETLSTIKETKDWIEFHKKFIKGLSINPVILYKFHEAEKLLKSFKQLGASLVDQDSLSKFGYAHLNLSKTVSFEKANELSLEIRRGVVSDKNFFKLKSFSYFDRFYSPSDFKNDIQKVDNILLPFYRSEFTK